VLPDPQVPPSPMRPQDPALDSLLALTWAAACTTAVSLAGLAAAADHIQRPAELGELEISVTPRGRISPALAAEFARAGVHRLVVLAPPAPDGPAQTIEAAAAAISGL
jgi:hypothetical protein